jgi:polysaccharide deacetylase family sporulation protein PdaB
MKFFWILNGKRLKQVLLIITAAFIAAAMAFMEQDYIPVFSTSDKPHGISKVNTEKKQIALTFDISWGDLRGKPILKNLEENDVEATFFINGQWADRHKGIVKKIVEGDHELGSHGFQHKNYTEMEEEEVRKDILLAQEMIEKVSGKKPTLLRPPNGNFNKQVLEVAEKLNNTVIHWSVNSKDWKNPGVATIVENVTSSIDPGDIVLLHASDSAKQTDKALSILIEQLKGKNYSFVTVSELLANGDVKSNIVQ